MVAILKEPNGRPTPKVVEPVARTAFGLGVRSVVEHTGHIGAATDDEAQPSFGRVLNEALAFAPPLAAEDHQMTVRSLHEARRNKRKVEVKIGVGALDREIPARVLGYASCIAGAIAEAQWLAGRVDEISLFSSAPKAGRHDVGRALLPLVALGGSLLLCGVTQPISLSLAHRAAEIDETLRPPLTGVLGDWIAEAAANHDGTVPYAYEHAAESMFGDVSADADSTFRITIGGRTEAPFWAVRMLVRKAAIDAGVQVTPAVGFIIKALQRPWYSPLPGEPPLRAMLDPSKAVKNLEHAANPHADGNSGLTREARNLKRFARDPTGVEDLVRAVDGIGSAKAFLARSNLLLSTPIARWLEETS